MSGLDCRERANWRLSAIILSEMEALIIASATRNAWAIPFLLSRAGFCVDVVTTARVLHLSKFTRDVYTVGPTQTVAEFAYEHIRARARPYDWVIATEDTTLGALAALAWPPEIRPKHSPISTDKALAHVYSKTGLSRALSAAGIKTPPFRVARTPATALVAAREIGYPVLIKVDASAGGEGVYECGGDADLVSRWHVFDAGPVLIQRKIQGVTLDLSAIYFEGELVHFSYSRIERTLGPFGPTLVRSYYPSPLVEPEVFAELTALGPALGADGFVNIGCIDAADRSGRYYFEADMRPNVWADFSVFYGEDAAPRIRTWFSDRTRLTKENAAPIDSARAPVTIPYFLRLGLLELLTNRYRVWEFIPFADQRLVRRLLISRLCGRILSAGRFVVPRTLRIAVKHRLVAAGVLFN